MGMTRGNQPKRTYLTQGLIIVTAQIMHTYGDQFGNVNTWHIWEQHGQIFADYRKMDNIYKEYFVCLMMLSSYPSTFGKKCQQF